MAAPPNTTFGTAVTIPALPYDIEQTGIHDAGTTYSVWYVYTAKAGDCLLSVLPYGDETYTPDCQVFTLVMGSPVAYLGINGGGNAAVQFPVTAGTAYYLQFVTNSGNPTPATLTLHVERLAQQAVPRGSILINDDNTAGFPLIAVDSTTGDVLASASGFPAGEQGEANPINGYLLVDNKAVAGQLHLFDPSLTELDTYAFSGPGWQIIRCNPETFNWWVYDTNTSTFSTISADGTLSATTHTMTDTTVNGMATSLDETKVYYGPGGAGQPVRVWNLDTDTQGTNLAAGVTNYIITDVMVLSSGDILVMYQFSGDMFIRRYDEAGTLLDTYALPGVNSTFLSSPSPSSNLAQALNDPASFWVRTHDGDDYTKIRRIRVSTGTIITTLTVPEFTSGASQSVYSGALADAPKFGVSPSCTFIITQAEAGDVVQCSLLHTLSGVRRATRRLRRFPLPFAMNKEVFISRFEVLLQAGVGLIDGQGSTPVVMCRFSKDGGKTWGTELQMGIGPMGKYGYRCFVNRLGRGRNWVAEVTVSDPVFASIVECWADVEEGSS